MPAPRPASANSLKKPLEMPVSPEIDFIESDVPSDKESTALPPAAPLVQVEPNLPQDFLEQGYALYQKGYYKEAIPLFEASMKDDAQSDQGRYTLGLCYMYSGQTAKAREIFEKMSIAQGNHATWSRLQLIRLDETLVPKEKIARIWDLLKHSTARTALWAELGLLYAEIGDWEMAIHLTKKSLRQGEESPLLYYNLGVFCEKRGLHAQALSYYERFQEETLPHHGYPSLQASVSKKVNSLRDHA